MNMAQCKQARRARLAQKNTQKEEENMTASKETNILSHALPLTSPISRRKQTDPPEKLQARRLNGAGGLIRRSLRQVASNKRGSRQTSVKLIKLCAIYQMKEFGCRLKRKKTSVASGRIEERSK
uniref:Uncharacterized protein n=1 Tax=Knipowitschia caucasica TaxID=637954 RepID=A0AAV2J3S2_KNICA